MVVLIEKGVASLPARQTEFAAHIFDPSNLVVADERYRILQSNTSNLGDMFQKASVRELEAEQRTTPKHFLLDNINKNGSALSFHLSSATNLYGEGSFRGDGTFYSDVYIGSLSAWGHTKLGECHYMKFWAVVGPPNAERLFPEILQDYIGSSGSHVLTNVDDRAAPDQAKPSCGPTHQAALTRPVP